MTEPVPDLADTLTNTERMAALMLITPNAIDPLTLGDALVIVDHMRPKRIAAGTTFMNQGESIHNDFMMLILEGDVTLELRTDVAQSGKPGSTVVGTAGPGEILGEVSVFTGLPRSVSCVAATDLAVAILTRARMQLIYEKNPDLAARFTFSMMARTGHNLQENLRKFKSFVQMNDALRDQLNKVMNDRVPGKS